MARPRLTAAEKQRREVDREEKREELRAQRRTTLLMKQRSKVLNRLLPWIKSIDWMSQDVNGAAHIRTTSDHITYDRLNNLSVLLETKNIDLTAHVPYQSYDSWDGLRRITAVDGLVMACLFS